MASPIVWICGITALLAIYFSCSPESIKLGFSQKGYAPVEIATVALFFFQILFFWLLPPVSLKTTKGRLLCLDFSVISFFAICREMDWHRAMIDVSHIETVKVMS